MSNYKTVFFTLGILQIILGIFMFIPVGVQFLYNEIDSSFFGASIVTIIFGTLFFLSNLDHNKKLNLQQAFLLTALSWLSIAIFGSLPFLFSSINLNAISFDLGRIFSDESLFEILKSCIPPTFIIGINVIAITIIPIPPNHWSNALHNKILLGISSRLEIIVEPVVVMPDMLSKNAFVNEKSILENKNGSEPNIAILNQDKAVNKNAC